MLRILLLLICSLLFSLSLKAQYPLPQLKWQTDDLRLQLKNDVTDVRIDSKGVVWIITFSEIVSYNGTAYKRIRTNNVNHSSFMRFGETISKKKYTRT